MKKAALIMLAMILMSVNSLLRSMDREENNGFPAVASPRSDEKTAPYPATEMY